MSLPDETYYDILGVPPDASIEKITSAYRKLAKILHPDVCQSPDAEDLFKAVNEAYQVLRDPKKREEYDASAIPSHASQYRGYYQGTRRYRDPRTWYYADPCRNAGRTQARAEENRQHRRQSTIPRFLQIILFYITLLMAIIIMAQLFLLPWINSANASDARTEFLEGNRWMGEEEYQKAIESYREATNRLPTFSEAWRARGIAEVAKADELTSLGKAESGEYYRQAIRSFSRVDLQDRQDTLAQKKMAYAMIMTGDADRALSILSSLPSGSDDPEVNSLIQQAHTLMSQGSRGQRSV